MKIIPAGGKKKSNFLEKFGATRNRPIVIQEADENEEFFNRQDIEKK